WQFSGISSFISGNPYELNVGIAGVNGSQRITGSWTEPPRLNLKADPSQGANGSLINADAFVLPAIGSDGRGPRMYLRNPGINNTDFALFKTFGLGGAKGARRLQLRL